MKTLNLAYLIEFLPEEILLNISSYFNYQITKLVCKRSNNLKTVFNYIQTPSAHCIHIMIKRFEFRFPKKLLWLPSLVRETHFINDSIQFHNKWTGPSIDYPKWNFDTRTSYESGIYLYNNPC